MATKQKRRSDKLYERKVWIPLPENYAYDGQKKSNIRYNPAKKIYEKRTSFYNKDKRMLDVEVNEIENQINKGTYVLDNDSTFEQLVRRWYKVHAVKKEETTRESYETYMNHSITLFGSMKIQGIKTSDIKEKYNDFLFKLDENGNKIILHSKNSLKHLHAVVNMAFKFAVEDSLLWKNPCDALDKKEMRPEKFESYVYTEDEFNSLLDKVEGTIIEIIALLAGGVGMRAGEICALKKNKINSSSNQITINESQYRTKGKTGDKKTKSKNRTIFVDPHIIKTIMEYQNEGEFVISRSTQKPYRNDELYHMFIDALKKNDLSMTRLHDLRHYNATQMALRGIDIKTAAYRLGDTPETVLKIYQHVQDQMDRTAAEKLGKMFKENIEQDISPNFNLNKQLENMKIEELEKLISKAKDSLKTSKRKNLRVVKNVVNN